MGSRRNAYTCDLTEQGAAVKTTNQAQDLTIIGLSARIDPALAGQQIPALWGQFLSELEPSTPMYAVYCDYEGDHARPYTLVLGCEAQTNAQVPVGQRRVRIPAGEFAVFEQADRPPSEVWSLWAQVNSNAPLCAARRFVADFERYPRAPGATGHVDVEVLVGLQAK